jgi:hypothetical protein
VAAGIREACISLIEQSAGSRDAAIEAFKVLQKERYATDIFGWKIASYDINSNSFL